MMVAIMTLFEDQKTILNLYFRISKCPLISITGDLPIPMILAH